MVTISKHFNEPLTLQITIVEQLDAQYVFLSSEYIPNSPNNSAEIILNLSETSAESTVFNYTVYQVCPELNGAENIAIQITIKDEEGKHIIHQESSTFIERPFEVN